MFLHLIALLSTADGNRQPGRPASGIGIRNAMRPVAIKRNDNALVG